MKHTVIVLLLAIGVVALAQTQKKQPVQGTDATAEAVLGIENKWVDALVKSDTASLDSIFADTYVDTDEHSHRSDKQGLLSVLKSGELKLESITLSGMRVHLYGDAAVVTGSAAQVGNFKGQALAPKIIFTDTFIKRNGKWIAVASHRSVAE
jgi:Domain of unknown function (DUF4440)